jgi:A/G-specific adenine glycosylase
MNKKQQAFSAVVTDFYNNHKRDFLPWRKTNDPYCILVSELMLQQTQVKRVVDKYESFINLYPTIHDLAKASLGAVLLQWQGLGYNRRAKLLHQCAQIVIEKYDGVLPKTKVELELLPGIGPYTAGAIMAFAYNKPVLIVETNIRTVYIHHFFKKTKDVTDGMILDQLQKTMCVMQPRDWYAALMDYGSYLKKINSNNIQQSKHYKKQSRYKGSRRELRGLIIKKLMEKNKVENASFLKSITQFSEDEILSTIQVLIKEGMIEKNNHFYSLPGVGNKK